MTRPDQSLGGPISCRSRRGGPPDGFVVNCLRSPTPEYLKLHRAVCKTISTATRSNWTTGDYIKGCAQDMGELGCWASEQTAGTLQPCGSCLSRSGGPRPKKDKGYADRDKRGSLGLTGEGTHGWHKFTTIGEWFAALIAVIGGIIAFIQWVF